MESPSSRPEGAGSNSRTSGGLSARCSRPSPSVRLRSVPGLRASPARENRPGHRSARPTRSSHPRPRPPTRSRPETRGTSPARASQSSTLGVSDHQCHQLSGLALQITRSRRPVRAKRTTRLSGTAHGSPAAARAASFGAPRYSCMCDGRCGGNLVELAFRNGRRSLVHALLGCEGDLGPDVEPDCSSLRGRG